MGSRDPDLFGVIMLGRLLPSWHSRQGICANIQGALAGRLDSQRWASFVLFRNWRTNDGAQLCPSGSVMREMTPATVEQARRTFYPDWQLHSASLWAVEQFLTLARKHDVAVFWLLPPIWPEFQDQIARVGIEAKHEALVRSFQERFTSVVVVDGRGAVTACDGYYDALHLSDRGAVAMSGALGDAVGRTLSAKTHGVNNMKNKQWIKLPHCPLARLPDRLENTEQSRVALDAANATVRR
jgi:hypothetical protein